MSADQLIVKRWTAKLKVREGLLAFARKQAAFWRAAKAGTHPGTAAYSHAAGMLADREGKVAYRKRQVAEAQEVVARHSVAAHVSDAGVALVKRFEGFVGHPYRDAVGVWTIGYGHTAGVGPSSKTITEKQASALLKRDLDAHYAPSVRALNLPLSQPQFDALVSFVYNVGPGGISSSTTVGRRLRLHDWRGAADALLAWNKAGGRVLPGLTRRRHDERALFLS